MQRIKLLFKRNKEKGNTVKSAHSGGARFSDFRFHLPRKQQNIRPVITPRQRQPYSFPVRYNTLPTPRLLLDLSCTPGRGNSPARNACFDGDLELIICCWICGGVRVATGHKLRRTMFVNLCGKIFNSNVLACSTTPHGVRCFVNSRPGGS